MTVYGRLSEVYDRLLYDAPADDWMPYLEMLLGVKPPARLLEYACGSGRLTGEFVRRGYEVIGVDKSREMLMQAQAKLHADARRCHLVEADMTAFSLEQPADACVCALDGVNYLLTSAQLQAFFVYAAANLKKGAPFLFDISSPYKIAHVLAEEFFYDDGEDETLLWTNTYDDRSGLLEMSLTVFARTGSFYERFDELHVIRAWTADEVAAALEAAGFCDTEIFAFGTTDAPADTAERLMFRTRKGD